METTIEIAKQSQGKYVINSRGLRFAEFVLKALPAQARLNVFKLLRFACNM